MTESQANVEAVWKYEMGELSGFAGTAQQNTQAAGSSRVKSLITTDQANKVFEAWEAAFRADHSDFLTADEVAQMEVATVSEQRAIYFMALLRRGKEAADAVIFSAPQGWGKTRHAQDLAIRYNCTSVIDEWSPGDPIKPGALHLTSTHPSQVQVDMSVTLVSGGWEGGAA